MAPLKIQVRPTPFSTNPSLKEADLPECYSIIPATANKKANIKIANVNNEIDQAIQDKITRNNISSLIEIEIKLKFLKANFCCTELC